MSIVIRYMENKEYVKGLVYKITSPSGRIYVGSTINLKRRKALYKGLHCKAQRKLFNSLKKYGFDSHSFEILWEGDFEEMLKQEALLGLELDVLNIKNLNSKLPKLNDVIKVVSDETRNKMSTWQIGRKMSEESKIKMRLAKVGWKPSEKTKQTASDFHSKTVIQMDRTGNFIKEWKSAKKASESLNITGNHISSCCRNKRKTTGGYKWKYKIN